MSTRRFRRSGAGAAATFVGALILGLPAATAPRVQEGGPPPQEEPKPGRQDDDDTDIDDLNPFRRPERGGPQAELRELFLKVDKRLNRVTELLYEASAGDMTGAGDIGSARIDELIREAESQAGGARNDIARLLEASRAQSSAASDEIGRILQLAEQTPQGSSGGGGQPPPPSSSQDGQPQQGQTPQGSRREDKGETGPDGQKPGEQPQNQEQGEQGEQGQQPQDRDGDGKPDGPQESDADPDQKPGEAPPDSETGDPSRAAGNEDWGDLPVHLRKVFENSVNDEVPARYRDWVDSYYKRLNRRSGR